jgi:hypothetical protein
MAGSDLELRERGHQFRALAERIREVPKDVRKELNRGLRDDTKPAEQALKEAVLGLNSAGKSGGGSRARLEHTRSRSRTGNVPRGQAHGLRARIAKGITRKISFTGSRMGVRIRADGKYLPENQRSLIRGTNKGKVRHPAGWGRNRGSVWVEQTFTPERWFDNTMRSEGPAALRRIEERARRVLESLTN